MESILRSDIFFFITSICVILITLVFLIAGFYFIKMLRNFYKISSILKNYTEDTKNELRDLSHHIRHSPLFTFIFGKEKVKKETKKD
jgi:uncharacterized membrane protein